MGFLESFLEKITGDVSFYIYYKDQRVAEIKLEEKTIIIDVLNPVLAMETVIAQLLNKKTKSVTLERVKGLGYQVRIKFKGIEVDL